jgi:hypothetical protein
MDTINQVQTTERTLDYWVDMAEALARLKQNPDFQKVIEQGYFKDKAVSGVSILALDQIKNNNRRADVMEGLVAISALQDHFYTIEAMSAMAKDEAESAEEVEAEAEAEGAEVLEG